MPQVEIPIDDNITSNSSIISASENGTATQSLSSIEIDCQSEFTPSPPFVPLLQLRSVRYELTLDEVLRQASGSASLETITHIQLRVMSNMFGLHHLNVFLPSLVELNLDGSSLNSLRDLGCDLNIKYLNVSRCGLRSLDGINGISFIEHLVADFNSIGDMLQLSSLRDLQKLSICGNNIRQLGAVTFLKFCAQLKDLDLTNNPITKIANYQHKVIDALPTLLMLDGVSIIERTKASEKYSSSEFSSSLTSSISKNNKNSSNESTSNNIQESPMNINRPSSSFDMSKSKVTIEIKSRPSTAEPFGKCKSILNDDAIVGNIISKVRRERRKKQHVLNSNSSTSNSSLANSISIDSNYPQFPQILPQSVVELELGIVVTEDDFVTNDIECNAATTTLEEHTFKILTAARKWREESERSRITGESNKE